MELPHELPSEPAPAGLSPLAPLHAAEDAGQRPPSGAAGARFSLLKFVVYLAAAAVAGLLVGGAAVAIENQFAPLLLFPLAVGAVLGGMLFMTLRVTQAAHAATVTLGIFTAALLTIAAQHYLPYLRSEHGLTQQKLAKGFALGGIVSRETFSQYLQRTASSGRELFRGYRLHGWQVWLSWGIDGLLVLAAALAMVLPALWLPFCPDCQTWYRTTRMGRLGRDEALPLARRFGVEFPERTRFIRFRLLSCGTGCGPTGFEISWREPRFGTSSVWHWLDGPRRADALAALEEIVKSKRRRLRLRRPPPAAPHA